MHFYRFLQISNFSFTFDNPEHNFEQFQTYLHLTKLYSLHYMSVVTLYFSSFMFRRPLITQTPLLQIKQLLSHSSEIKTCNLATFFF